jgi:ABC-2 type transport system permease protein
MGAVLAIAGLGWRRLWRDPFGLAFTFLAPIAVALVMVGIFRSQDPHGGYPLGVVVDDDGAVGHDLLGRLATNPVLKVERYDDRRSVERAVRRRDVAAAVVVPSEVETRTDGPVVVDLIGPPEVAAPNGVRAAVEASVSETAATLQLGRTLLPDATTGSSLAAGQIALDLAGGAGDTRSTAVSSHGAWWDGASLAVLGTLVLFVVMNTMAGSSLLAELRELGIVARMRTTSASPAQLGLGFGLGWASYALVVAVLVLATGRIVFAISWASWPSLAVVVVALALAAGALGLVTGTLLPSVESGTTIAGPAGFMLGMVGGCLWPLEMVGPTLRRVGHLTPQAWAVEGLRSTGIGGAGLDDVAPQLAALAVFTAGLLLVGGWRLARIAAQA